MQKHACVHECLCRSKFVYKLLCLHAFRRAWDAELTQITVSAQIGDVSEKLMGIEVSFPQVGRGGCLCILIAEKRIWNQQGSFLGAAPLVASTVKAAVVEGICSERGIWISFWPAVPGSPGRLMGTRAGHHSALSAGTQGVCSLTCGYPGASSRAQGA